MGITFGTDGWRAILGKDFTKENVKRVSLAIAKYVIDNLGYDKKILIGYDPRNQADVLSYYCGEILASAGLTVLYSDRILPTPTLAYNAKILNASAIMFTASHNPPEYLGMKYIPDYAGPATSEITNQIITNLDIEIPPKEGGSITKYDFSKDYFKHLESIIDFEIIKTLKTNIIYDGLYSASIGYLDSLLDKYGIKYQSINTNYDINFGGGMPDPKPKYLKDLISFVKENNNTIGIATDGDADRFGVVNELGEFVSPNEIIAILLKHLLNKNYRGAVVKTVGSSLLIDIVAKKLNVPVIETAVGFKHVGEAMRLNDVIIGGEESGGLSIKGHIPEKDGVIANLLILEAIANSGKRLYELQEELYNLAGIKFYNDRIDLELDDREKIKNILSKIEILQEMGGLKSQA